MITSLIVIFFGKIRRWLQDSVLWYVVSEILARSFQFVGIVAITIWHARRDIAEIILFVGLLILIILAL